ncbi:nitrilase-related carbon-nitrogen hydrolase [Klebsiella pneumoniae]|nr:hypothetical protein [Klebsiella pneumoniae]
MLSPLGHSGPDQSPQKLKIACIQFEPKFGEVEHNVTRSIDLIEQAAGYGARLIVLPELCSTGYIFQSREDRRTDVYGENLGADIQINLAKLEAER